MKANLKRTGIIVLAAVFGLILTGCLSMDFISNSVSIRNTHNLVTVCPGGTLVFSASGQNILWSVSSTSDGSGYVTNGTFISANGVLTVAADETMSNLYVIATSANSGMSDYKLIRVVTVRSINISPTNQVAAVGRTLQFSATVTGTNNPDQAVTWKVSSNAAGTGAVTPGTNISANGLLTVAAGEALSTLHIIATSAVDTSQSGSIPVAIVVPTVTNVAISAPSQTVRAGTALQFSASVTGTYNPGSNVTWRVSSNAAGTGAVTPGTVINPNGQLTVASNETLSTLYIIATSSVDTSKHSSVHVNVIRPTVTGVSVHPSGQSVTTGGSLQFSASVTGTNDPDPSVHWSVSSNAAGTGSVVRGTSVNANGLLTVSANETAGNLFVFASSVFDPTKSGSVIVTVTVLIPTVTGVSVSPSGQSIPPGRTLQFTAAVTGTNNPSPAVTWKVSSNAAGTGAVTAGTTINANGLLNVIATESLTTLYVFATSVTDPTKTGSVPVTVTSRLAPTPAPPPAQPAPTPPRPTPTPAPTPAPAPTPQRPAPAPTPVTPTVTAVVVSPSTASTMTNRTVQFSAAVSGSNNPNTAVTWKVSSNAAGTGEVAPRTTISNSGLLTVAPNEWATILYVFATSAADPSKTGSAAVTITNNNANQGSNRGN